MKLDEIVTYTLTAGQRFKIKWKKIHRKKRDVVKSVDEARAKIHWRKLLV